MATLTPWYAFSSAVGNIFRRRGTQSPAPQSYSAASAAPVTLETAMQVSAFWACVRLIAETIGSLPFVMYERKGDVRTVSDHPLALLFADKVNRYQSRQDFFESLAFNLATTGNAYAVIQRADEKIIGLLPLMSGQVEVKTLADGETVYCYTEDGVVRVFADANIWHLKLFGNGVIGLSPLAYARNSVGMAIAGDTRTGNLWKNGGKVTLLRSFASSLRPLAFVGDGATDLETQGSAADLFVGFGGVAIRPVVKQRAEAWFETPSLAPILSFVLTDEERERLARDPRFTSLMQSASATR